MARPPVVQNETGASVPAAPVWNAAGVSIATATPVVSTSPAYTSGDVIGGKMTFPGMAREAGGSGLVQMVSIFSKSAQSFAGELWLFHTDPSNSTFTDNAAFSLNAADFDKVAAVVPISTWYPAGTPSFAEAAQLAMPYKLASNQVDMQGVLVARATPTLASTSDIKVTVKGLLD